METGIPLEDARKTAAALRRKDKRHAHKLYHYCAAVLAYYKDAGLMSEEAYGKIRSRRFCFWLFAVGLYVLLTNICSPRAEAMDIRLAKMGLLRPLRTL